MNWLQRNSKTIIKTVYILPILIAAGVSISHVITWYGLTNPISWAVYLSIGIEVAALSALAGITTNISRGAYIPFFIVTFIQFIGNIFFAYQFIDITGPMFKDWVDLVGDMFGRGDLQLHRRILALIGGGLIPMISLSFLHLLVSFTNKEGGVNDDTGDKDEKISPRITTKKETEDKWREAGLLDELGYKDNIIMHTNQSTSINEPPKQTIDDIIEGVVDEITPNEVVIVKDEEEEPIKEDPIKEDPIKEDPIKEDPIKEDPIEIKAPGDNGKIKVEDIKEIKEMKDRKFSVNIPERKTNNKIRRV